MTFVHFLLSRSFNIFVVRFSELCIMEAVAWPSLKLAWLERPEKKEAMVVLLVSS